MDNLITETNTRLQEIIDNLALIKDEYEEKIERTTKEIDEQLAKVKKYKEDFFDAKEKINKMNADIEGFEEDYQNLVDKFKDDELANILIAANKEISARIEERKRKIVKDKQAMNQLVEKAENVKQRLIKLTAEKKALEVCLHKILDSYNYYNTSLSEIITYSSNHQEDLCAYFDNHLDDSKEDDYEEEYNIDDLTIENEEESIEELSSQLDEEEEDDNFEFSEDTIEEESKEENIEDEYDEEKFSEALGVDFDTIDEIEIEIPEDFDDFDEEIIDDYKNEDVIEGDEHTIVVNDKQEYNFSDDLDLENMLNFDDSLEDIEKEDE